nr:hypothetical protein Iba_chr04aCG14710 [Ipomoea batatas]
MSSSSILRFRDAFRIEGDKAFQTDPYPVATSSSPSLSAMSEAEKNFGSSFTRKTLRPTSFSKGKFPAVAETRDPPFLMLAKGEAFSRLNTKSFRLLFGGSEMFNLALSLVMMVGAFWFSNRALDSLAVKPKPLARNCVEKPPSWMVEK